MRITGGELKGRTLKSPASVTRPTQDRVREALFSMLTAELPGSRFLDMYAGTGAVGLEAWSRGAAEVWWVESSSKAAGALRENVRALTGSDSRVRRADAVRFVREPGTDLSFNIIFADPPYAEAHNVRKNLFPAILQSRILADDGVVVLEEGAVRDSKPGPPAGFEAAGESRVYGDTMLSFFRKSLV